MPEGTKQLQLRVSPELHELVLNAVSHKWGPNTMTELVKEAIQSSLPDARAEFAIRPDHPEKKRLQPDLPASLHKLLDDVRSARTKAKLPYSSKAAIALEALGRFLYKHRADFEFVDVRATGYTERRPPKTNPTDRDAIKARLPQHLLIVMFDALRSPNAPATFDELLELAISDYLPKLDDPFHYNKKLMKAKNEPRVKVYHPVDKKMLVELNRLKEERKRRKQPFGSKSKIVREALAKMLHDKRLEFGLGNISLM